MKKAMIFIFVLSLLIAFAGCNTDKNLKNEETETSATQSLPLPSSSEDNHITALLKSNLDILAESDSADILVGNDLLQSPSFREIVALGEKALPYLELLTDRSNKNITWLPNLKFEHRACAVRAIYAIRPETYDLSFPSPDGKYTAKILVDSFASFYNHGRSFNAVQIIENASNKSIYKTELSHAFTLGGLYYVKGNWSKDSKYILIDCTGQRSGSVMAIDVKEKRYFCLPGLDEAVKRVYPNENAESLISVPRAWFEFDSWESEKVVNIDFSISNINRERGNFRGWYTFDLEQEKILKFHYDFNQ